MRRSSKRKVSRFSLFSTKKSTNLMNDSSINGRKHKVSAAWIDLIQFTGGEEVGSFFPSTSTSNCNSLSSILEPNRPCTIGRSSHHAQITVKDPRVSKQHCQILFDANVKKLYLLNGALLFSNCCSSNSTSNDSVCVVNEFRKRLIFDDQNRGTGTNYCCDCVFRFKPSLNGVFVNGVRVSEGLAVELCVGDEVMLACVNGKSVGVGFIIRRILFQDEVDVPGCEGFRFDRPRLVRPLLSPKGNKRVFALRVSDSESPSMECNEVVGRAKSLAAHCKRILRSEDPVSCILKSVGSDVDPIGGLHDCVSKEKRSSRDSKPDANMPVLKQQTLPCNSLDVEKGSDVLRAPIGGLEGCVSMEKRFRRNSEPEGNVSAVKQQTLPCYGLDDVEGNAVLRATIVQSTDIVVSCGNEVSLQPKVDHLSPEGGSGAMNSTIADENNANASTLVDMDGKNPIHPGAVRRNECFEKFIPPPGKNFYLNRLEDTHQNLSDQQNVVSLPELLHPVDSISRIFIATFTSDVEWFLSCCDIPSHLPITIACHNAERCWNSDPERRSCVPYPDFPNVVMVYPPFPEAIAFGNDRRKKGVACHHPKLLVLQREDTMRVIITSANLVAKQWNHVTNTIWWQDFPRRNSPDCTSLFNQMYSGFASSDIKSDFAAQLAGFMATLLTDVPSQAHWIVEMTKYDFTGVNVYLVASVPGIHSYRSPPPSISVWNSKCRGKDFGSVEVSVVGISHRFRTAKDSNGVELKKLAAYLGKSSDKESGMSEIILRRNKDIQADPNAVSVLVPNPTELSEGDCVQLGFLPRTVAKWVAPLWDIGFFRFHGCVSGREAVAAAFGEKNIRVRLILNVSQGPHFHNFPKMISPEHVIAFCSLIASVQRSTGLWRLEEVLQQYKWPEHLESDFTYCSSSIGTSVNAQFLAAFSSAAGKKSQQIFDSEESDPEWGCWNASHELKHPSIRIIFPTIERVKSAHRGILASKHMLCFSEKTWQRLKTVGILHDAVPSFSNRVGHPMHVKVARRRFQSKADKPSFGWTYCGSHNMSAAAWGRQISGPEKGRSSGLRLHVCNYELGVIFVFPPPQMKDGSPDKSSNLDDIHLPFIMPAPKYGPRDRPATMRAMSEALAELAERERGTLLAELASEEEMEKEVPDEEDDEVAELVNFVAREEEKENAYADVLWSQVDSSQSC